MEAQLLPGDNGHLVSSHVSFQREFSQERREKNNNIKSCAEHVEGTGSLSYEWLGSPFMCLSQMADLAAGSKRNAGHFQSLL